MNPSINNLTVWLAYVSYPVTSAAYFERALRRMLDCVTLGPQLPPHLIKDWKLERMRLPIRPHTIPTDFTPDIGRIMATVAEENRPDLFLYVESIAGFTPKNMSSLSCPTACYLIDSHRSLSVHRELAKQFDYVFIAQRAYLDEIRKVNSHSYWLPLGCDPEIHFGYPVSKCYDIGFAGGFVSGDRRHALLQLLENNFTLGYERVFWDEMALLFSQSRIIFNNAVKDDLNMRCFEALSVGSMLLSDMAHGSGLDELFIPGEDYVLYTDDTLIDVARHYLMHDGDRERIAGNGKNAVLAAHTYAHRVQDLLAVIFANKRETFSASELRVISKGLDETTTVRLGERDYSAYGSFLPAAFVYHVPECIRRVVLCSPEKGRVIGWALQLSAALDAEFKHAADWLSEAESVKADNEYDLVIVDDVSQLKPFRQISTVVVIVLDVRASEYDFLLEVTHMMPLIYVTTMNTYSQLCTQGRHNIRFMPFDVADGHVSGSLFLNQDEAARRAERIRNDLYHRNGLRVATKKPFTGNIT